jgi:hypothetical protein
MQKSWKEKYCHGFPWEAKLKGSKELEHYILFCSGVSQEKRAAAGVAIMIKKKLMNSIYSSNFVNEIIVTIGLWIDRGYISIVGVYAPEEGWAEDAGIL